MKWDNKVITRRIYYTDLSKSKIVKIANANDWEYYYTARIRIKNNKSKVSDNEEIELNGLQLLLRWVQKEDNSWKVFVFFASPIVGFVFGYILGKYCH